MSQLLGCLEHLQIGALSMVTSVWETENNHRGINQGSRADDRARTLVFGLKVLVQQLHGEPVHCREEETNCLVLSMRAGHGVGRYGVARLQMKVGHMDGMHCFIDSTSILVKIKSGSFYRV